MKPTTAFATFQTTVNADPGQLSDARLRRDAFVTALASRDDVLRARCVGSLARKTQIAPLNDVDVIVVYDPDSHESWGSPGIDSTANDALVHTATTIKSLLGPDGSKVDLLNPDGGTDLNVRLAKRKRHSVKSFLDKAGDPDAFTVDVVPAIEHPFSGLWIPERNVDDDDAGTWIRTPRVPHRLRRVVPGQVGSMD